MSNAAPSGAWHETWPAETHVDWSAMSNAAPSGAWHETWPAETHGSG
jgi:hypothetical protein